ncbi:CDP-glucose 4,6-dehydratase [Tepiditoga spiralis]|uniref:CDP-glucose 4,6-dehydratase n=1 Tax=Tepiditoga spiralis TaxID=2108365 RepID=A0A7G1G5Q6_9BACT|nr:CDP-glucose 4,6-dehydratase [Tepiditoga spiralis]BBE30626.1 CDP-glucose 4,6-dehydratase [Tepiditoga spiralis]
MKNFYKNKKVLITGHTGFKGSWLTIWLLKMGAKVIGYALDPYTQKDNFVLSKLSEKIIDIRDDVRNYDNLKNTFEKYKPDIIFHMAAQPLVRLSYKMPRDTFETNIMGTVNVLEAFKNTEESKVLINITSDKCYENKEWIWGYRENDPMGGYDPYSASKGASEIVSNAYLKSFFNPEKFNKHKKAIATVRAGNVIGGGDWAKDRIIPDCIRALEKDIPIEIRNPNAIRPWQNVLEPLSGYLLLGTKLLKNPKKYSGSWNFGPHLNSIITVREIVEKVIENYGNGFWKDLSNNTQPHEAKLLNLDISKSKFYLNWEPTLNISETINLTIDWYKNYKKENVYELCMKQIKYFENKKTGRRTNNG